MKTAIKICFLIFIVIISNHLNGQTTISGGNVSGTWTKAASPYKVNDNITIPNGQTLQIEPGVRIEFAQFKYMLVDGRILAQGNSGTTDSIWFTKQNTHDTGSWKGVKFIKTNNANDTSIFKYCVFRNCKSLYDTALAFRSGGITVLGYGKVKITNTAFYINEANVGACIFVTTNAYVQIKNCWFYNNKASQFWFKKGSSTTAFRPKGSAISIEYNSNATIEGCVFEKNYRGKDYRSSPTILYEASVVDIEGYSFYKKNAFATINNCVFDGNEGVVIYAYDKVFVAINSSLFKNGPEGKTRSNVKVRYYSNVYMNKCEMSNNYSPVQIETEGSNLYFRNGNLENNFGSLSLLGNTTDPQYLLLENTKIFNNSGAIYGGDSTITGGVNVTSAKNCLIANNNFASFFYGDTLFNCTVVNNRTSNRGIFGDNIRCRNTIIWGNKSDSFPMKIIFNYPNSYNSYTYNIIENDTDAIAVNLGGFPWKKASLFQNNSSLNPQFVNPSQGSGVGYDASKSDFRLKSNCTTFSPGINSGSPDTLGLKLQKVDLFGNRRVYENHIDIGCYEDNSGSPQIAILQEPKGDTLCKGSREATLALNAFGKGLNYQWQSSSNNGNSWSDMQGKIQNTLSLDNTNFSQNAFLYRALLFGTCDSDTSLSVQIITNELPKVNLGMDTAVCGNNSIEKRVFKSGNIMWHTGSSDSLLNQSIIKDSLWWCEITSLEGCVNRDSVLIKRLALPAVDLGVDQSLHKLKKLELHAGSGQKSYLWDDQSSKESRSFFGQDLGAPGKYTLWVEVENSNSCKNRDSIDITVYNDVSIESVVINSIVLYPQPADDIITVKLPPGLESNNYTVQLFNMNGNLILENLLDENETRISVSLLSSGVYLLKIKDVDGNTLGFLKWTKL